MGSLNSALISPDGLQYQNHISQFHALFPDAWVPICVGQKDSVDLTGIHPIYL